MTSILKTAAAAALMTGATLFASASARAHEFFEVSIGVPGVAFSYDSGGFCDRWGCPGDYWGYPVFYGPVFFDGVWFNGPVYYRVIDGDYWYWVHGGWHRDAWHGPRPHWWGHYHYGPALGYAFYTGHGFHHGHDRFWHGNDWHSHGRGDNGWHGGDRHGWNRHDGGDRGRGDFDGGRGHRDRRGGHDHGGDHDHGGRRGHHG